MDSCQIEYPVDRWPYSRRCREQPVAVAVWEYQGQEFKKLICRKHKEEAVITPDVEVKELADGNA